MSRQMSFTNCQAAKCTCNKSKLSNRRLTAKQNVVLKIYFKSQAIMSFTNCQAAKSTCNKSKLSNRRLTAKQNVVLKI